MSKSTYNGLFQRGTRLAGIRSPGLVVMLVHWCMNTLLRTNFSYQNISLLIARVRFKKLSLFIFENVRSNIKVKID